MTDVTQLDLGAILTPSGVRFRVWAPDARSVLVVLDGGRELALRPAPDGTWSGVAEHARAGSRYRFRIDDSNPYPDPYSRSQPEGVHGWSEVVEPNAFEWHDANWRGLQIKGLVIYQCHVGTATPDGTFDGLIELLPRIAELGVNAIEPLPLAEFPGNRNWGYDGVDLFAPTRAYGGPHGLKRLVDAAHAHGLGVILDVVYNHFGPDGAYVGAFAREYFTNRYSTPWGDAINYDGPHSEWVRRLVLDNARYWIEEFHADGLRLDATHAIHDASPRHVLAELSDTVRAAVAGKRSVVLIAETHENDVRYFAPTSEGGLGIDAVWADEFHHALRRYLAGDHESYYARYTGTLEEVARCIHRGWLRGTDATGCEPWRFVYVIQNHDQIGNRAMGDRLNHNIDLERYRAASSLLLFLAQTPMLFMGQEFAASTPFQYFTDHNPELGRLVTEGRRQEFKDFSVFADPVARDRIPDPQAESTFVNSKLRWDEADRSPGREVRELYRALLRLRREDVVLQDQSRERTSAEAVTPDVLTVRRWSEDQERLLIVNFGDEPYTVRDGGTWRLVLNSSGHPGAQRVEARSASILARTRQA